MSHLIPCVALHFKISLIKKGKDIQSSTQVCLQDLEIRVTYLAKLISVTNSIHSPMSDGLSDISENAIKQVINTHCVCTGTNLCRHYSVCREISVYFLTSVIGL